VDERDELLVVLTVQLLRGPGEPLDGTVEAIRAIINQLRRHYSEDGAPYGDDEMGFQRLLLDLWPAPLMA